MVSGLLPAADGFKVESEGWAATGNLCRLNSFFGTYWALLAGRAFGLLNGRDSISRPRGLSALHDVAAIKGDDGHRLQNQ